MKAKLVVLGYKGFLGSHVIDALKNEDYGLIEYRTKWQKKHNFVLQEDTENFYQIFEPEIVINCLGFVGGIGLNQRYPAKMFYDNLQMNLNAIHYAYKYGVKKFVQIGTTCSYPKYTQTPFKEEYLWQGFLSVEKGIQYNNCVDFGKNVYSSNYPEETNAPYGIAKRVLLTMLEAYRQECNFNGIYLIPTNLYGENDGGFINDEKEHIIPAIIKRVYDARLKNLPSITCWGTGNPTRDFLYVKDAAAGIIAAMELYDGVLPINLGSGQEISIKTVVELVGKILDYRGKIEWDTTKPDGQPRRQMDISRAREYLKFDPQTNFEDGLKKIIEWYLTTRK